MVRKILQIGDPILEEISKEVEDVKSKDIQKLIDDMLDTCYEVEERSAGLSAPQVGVGLRICICRRVDLEEQLENTNQTLSREKLWEVMINPEVKVIGDMESVYWEGCLSIGKTEKDTLFGPVARPDDIEIDYLTREGIKKKISAQGFFAHVVQHELDHLNGVLFISKVINPGINMWKGDKLDEYIKREGDYPDVIE